jgi:hypothetical protein
MPDRPSKLERLRHPMPDFVRDELVRHDLMSVYSTRPDYQQNDYIGWITQAKLPATREKRLAQMIDELRAGDLYMKMFCSRKR